MTLISIPQTDDVGIFGSPLSKEYYLAAEHFKLTREELIELAENVIDLIFADSEKSDSILPVGGEKAVLRKVFAEFRAAMSTAAEDGAKGEKPN